MKRWKFLVRFGRLRVKSSISTRFQLSRSSGNMLFYIGKNGINVHLGGLKLKIGKFCNLAACLKAEGSNFTKFQLSMSSANRLFCNGENEKNIYLGG